MRCLAKRGTADGSTDMGNTIRPKSAAIQPTAAHWGTRSSYLKFDGAGADFIDFFAGLGSTGYGVTEAAEESKRVVPSEACIVGGRR